MVIFFFLYLVEALTHVMDYVLLLINIRYESSEKLESSFNLFVQCPDGMYEKVCNLL